MKLTKEFYTYKKTPQVAKDLLWKLLVFENNWVKMSGIINETEAYTQDDHASHSHRSKITKRTKIMFERFGYIYVYFIYGKYFCFNIVTENIWYWSAVLIRSIIPVDWIEEMKKNRWKNTLKWLTDGPSKLCMAFWFTKSHYGIDTLDPISPIYIEDIWNKITYYKATPRIWISKWNDMLWRFVY